VKAYYHPARRKAFPVQTPQNDPVYPGWIYMTDGLGPWGRTDYAANDQIILPGDAARGRVVSVGEIADGSSNVILVGEKALDTEAIAAGSFYWDEPVILGGAGGTARCGLGLFQDSPFLKADVAGPGVSRFPDGGGCGGGNWGSPDPAGVQFVFGDGSVHMISYGVSDNSATFSTIMWRLIRPSDGNKDTYVYTVPGPNPGDPPTTVTVTSPKLQGGDY
jgi:hypothetical protein